MIPDNSDASPIFSPWRPQKIEIVNVPIGQYRPGPVRCLFLHGADGRESGEIDLRGPKSHLANSDDEERDGDLLG